MNTPPIAYVLAVIFGTLAWIELDPRAKKVIHRHFTKNKDPLRRVNLSKSFQRRHLMTAREYPEYRKLQKIAASKGFIVCPKVRLLDIIEPRPAKDQIYTALLYKVQSKHVDFVICDAELNIKAIVELDDTTHDRPDRQERDKFVDQILGSVGYKVIHTRSITPDVLNHLG